MGLDASGVVWAWGENASGQLGDGSNQSRLYPVKVIEPSDRSGLLTGITALDAGNGYWLEFGGHTLALKADGSAWAWGHNAAGQLGDDTQISRSHAVPVLGLSGVSALATGFDHSLAAKSADGSVWGWGYNYYGQVGDGTLIDRHTPVPVREITNVTALAGGRYHSLALKGDGTVWAWGGNGSGQLGNGAWGGAAEAPPTQSVYAHDTSIPLTGMTAIAAGANHSLALRSDRTVWSWGDNGEGQLGDGTWGVIGDWGENAAVQVIDPSDPSGKLSGVVAIAAGTKHSLAVKEDGTVWAWGANNWGQLGDGTLERKHTPTQVSGLTDIASVGAGNGHSLAIGDPPSVAWAWGGNWSGQLGDGTYEQRTTPVQVAFLPEEHGLLKVIGPYYVTPGEELANVVRVENVLDEPLVDVVVLFHLSSDFTYLSSTQDGTYLEQPHRVFWLLGDIAPEETVYAAVNLMVDWGLPEHLTGSMNVELGAQNLEASFDVQAYLDYESALVGEQQLTATEIAEALAADSHMAELMSYSEEMGFESYEVAKRFEYRDGSSIIVLVLLNQDQQSLAILTSDGSRAYVESFDGTVYRIFDLNGGYIEELATGILAPFGSWTDSPLNQPLSAAAATLLSKVPRAVTVPKNYSTCLRNCVLMQGVDYLAGKISSVWSTIKAMGRMDACLHLSDPKKRFRACQDVANEVAKMSDLGKAAVGISRCFPDCNDPAKLGEYVCERKLIRCASKNTKEQWYDSAWYWIGRRFDTKFERRAIFSYGCNVETGAWHLVAARLHCDRSPSFLCEVNDRCRNDPDKQAIVDRCCVEDPCDPAATKFTEDGREDACEPIDTESVVAMDPNEKVVDWRGDVVPGQPLSYTVHYENIGAGTAFGVYITDELSVNLDAASLVVNDGGHYLSAIRRLSWNLGELASGQGVPSASVSTSSTVCRSAAKSSTSRPSISRVSPRLHRQMPWYTW